MLVSQNGARRVCTAESLLKLGALLEVRASFRLSFRLFDFEGIPEGFARVCLQSTTRNRPVPANVGQDEFKDIAIENSRASLKIWQVAKQDSRIAQITRTLRRPVDVYAVAWSSANGRGEGWRYSNKGSGDGDGRETHPELARIS